MRVDSQRSTPRITVVDQLSIVLASILRILTCRDDACERMNDERAAVDRSRVEEISQLGF